ncbi:PREDICTED: uncharacterized protein LOC106805649 [Priapulus caudatus]|uniref:Uncharacterized protein LOC106805649 n=1 Tax=Priapulus caudatus TaxID=37621 RepID=A0ABM1DSA2_PRICU|nr:PREDICTED: uncharacterized protein LOC106805649 [Priapulus caudatus]
MVAEGAARVLLEFVVPHNAYTYQTCSGGGAPGGGTPHCNKIGFVSLQVDPPDRNTITVIVGDSLTSDNFLAPNVTFSANLERVFFDFGIVRNVEDGVLNAADTILIKIPILIRQGYNRVGQVLPFRSIANQTLLPLPTSVIADLTLLVIGPDLSIYTQAQPLSDIEAGTVVNFTTTFFHSTASTENIVQLQVWAKTQDAGMRMLPEVIYFFSGSQDMPYRVTAAELESGIKIGFLNQTDWMRLLFQVRATNSLLINSHPAVRIDASFSGERERKISKSYTTVSTRTVAAKNLLYRSDIGFRTGIRVDEPVTITLTMNMPLGTLNDLSIRAEFKSSDFDEIPIVMINSEVQSSASIHFGPDAANSTGFSVRAMPKPSSLSRRDVTESVANHGCPRCDNSVKQEATEHRIKKRQIQSSLYIVRWIGDVLNPSLGGTSYDAFNITLQFIVPASDAVRHGQLLSFMPTMVFSGRPFDFGRHTFMIVEPRLEIIKTMQYTDDSLPNEIYMNVLVSHQEESSAPAFDIYVQDNYRGMRIKNYTMYMPDGSTGNLTVEADSFDFFVDTLAVGKSLLLSYLASPQEALNQETAANRSYNFNASMLYRSIRPSEALSPEFPGRKYGPVETTVCVETRHESVKQLQLQHGYTVLAVIMAILLGFIVSLLFMYVVSRSDTCRRCLQGRCRQHQRRVQPSDVAQDDEQTDMLAGEPQVSNLTINSVVDPEESIEPLLGLGDRLQKQKDLDSLDIACSKQRDIVLEEQRTQAVLDATNIMIGNMQARGEVSPSVAARCMAAFQEYWQLSQDRLRAQHQQQMSATLVDNNRSSKAAQDEMTSRHEQERLDLTSKLDSLVIGDEEKTELVDLQQQQHEAERRELQYNLLLQQEQALQQLCQVL